MSTTPYGTVLMLGRLQDFEQERLNRWMRASRGIISISSSETPAASFRAKCPRWSQVQRGPSLKVEIAAERLPSDYADEARDSIHRASWGRFRDGQIFVSIFVSFTPRALNPGGWGRVRRPPPLRTIGAAASRAEHRRSSAGRCAASAQNREARGLVSSPYPRAYRSLQGLRLLA